MNLFREKLLKYGTCFTIFILSLLYFSSMYSPYVSSKTFFFYGLVEILTVFWIYSLITDRSYRLTKKQLLLFIPLFLYIIWLSIAGIFGSSPTLSFWSSIGRGTGLLTLYHALALSFIISSLVKRDGLSYLHKLLYWLLNSGFILALSVWFGDEGFKLFLNDSKGGGLIGNSSMTAAYFLFVIALGLFILFSKNIKNGKKWWIGIILVTIIFSPLFINIYGLFIGKGVLGSARGATLGIMVILGVSVLGWMILSKNKILKILSIIGILSSIIIFSIGWAQLMKPGTYIHEKFSQAASGTRFIFWGVAEKGIDKHPYIGYGMENYNIAFQDFFNPKILDSSYGYEGWPDHAHNIYYDIGISGGYPAIFFYFTFLLSIFYGVYRAYRVGNVSKLQAGIIWGLIIGYIFENLFVFDSMLSFMILFVLAGIIFALGNVYIKEKNLKVKISDDMKNTLASILFLSYIPLFVFFVYMPIRKAVVYNNLMKMTIDERSNHYNDLLKGSNIGGSIDVSSMASVIYEYYSKNLPQIKNDKSLSPYVEADLKSLTSYLDKVIDKYNNDFRLYISTVFLYNTEVTLTEKPYDQVLANHLFSLLDHAHKLSPTNPEVYWAKANIYAWQGDLKSAEGAYRDAIALDPNTSGSYRLLINFAKVVGNQKLYTESLAQAQKYIPDFKPE